MLAIRPVTNPVDGVTDAWNELLLAHVPPADVFANAVVEPIHTLELPVIAAGNVLTTIGKVV